MALRIVQRFTNRSWWRGLLSALAAPPADMANALVSPQRASPVAPRWRLLFLLLLLALAPRMVMALRIPAVCPDATIYLDDAQALDRGDLRDCLEGMNLNTLLVALAALHRLGLDWEQSGLVWGVLISTAAVAPLFGWARRQFDDRTAALTCVLYAAHPGLVERSPEIIREPTFWFFLLSTLYFQWRAASDGQYRWFLLAGVGFLLALLTRFEAVFLLIPLLWWTGLRWVQLSEQRRRTAMGLFIALFAIPLILATINFLVLGQAATTALVRLDPLERAMAWLHSWNDAAATTTMQAGETAPRAATIALIQQFVVAVGRGFDPVVAILLPFSLFGWGRLWLRRDIVPLLMMSASILGATWIHLWYSGEISSRYALTVFLLLSPLCALGLCWPQSRRALLPGKLAQRPQLQGALLLGSLVLLTLIGWSDALGSNFKSRAQQAELGRWLAKRYGDNARMAGSQRAAALVAFYARADFQDFDHDASLQGLLEAVESYQPEVLVVDRREQEFISLLELPAIRARYAPITDPAAPRADAHMLVLVRPGERERLSQIPATVDAGRQ
jgi:hypothetical protein